MAEKQLHQGHRQRLRNRFMQEGLDHFEQHNMLELLLFYSIPQRDTNEVAHRLLNRFGTISDVLNAPVEELETVEGVGHSSALLISSVHQISDIYRRDKTERRKIVGLAGITADCVSRCAQQSESELLLVCADNTQTLLNMGETLGKMSDAISGIQEGGTVSKSGKDPAKQELQIHEQSGC